MSTGRDITMRTPSGRRLTAFLACPDSADVPDAVPHPGVLVVHELMGLNDDIRRISSVFADNGFVALAPDLLGAGFKPLCMARFMQGMGNTATGRPYREMAAFQDWLGRQAYVDADRLGMAGFCVGGGFTILYASKGDRPLRAIAPFYGSLPADDSIIPALCPTVASYGGRDATVRGIPERLEAGLREAGIPGDVKVYPEAGHSFMSRHGGLLGAVGPRTPMHSAFDEEASADAWARVLGFFGEHLSPRTAPDAA
jgi:carboxymethylenebutenolidase